MRCLILFIVILLINTAVHAQDKPIAVDGDTFKVNGEYYRLYEIDTPEKGEPLYDRAKNILQDWLDHNKSLYSCKYKGKGTYGRHITHCPAIEYKLYELIPNSKWYEKD